MATLKWQEHIGCADETAQAMFSERLAIIESIKAEAAIMKAKEKGKNGKKKA